MSEAVQSSSPSAVLSGRVLAVSLLRRLPSLLLAATAASVLTLTGSLLTARRYRAEVSFSTLSANRASALAGAIPSALLAAANVGGLQPSPALLSRLARSQNIEARVARMAVPGRNGATVADVIEPDPVKRRSDARVAATLAKLVSSDVDRETGLVTIVMNHKDSTLARFVVSQLVAEVTTVFQQAVMSQVADTRRSVARRLDAAASRLRDSERRSQEFAAGNRQIAPYSTAAMERDRLARELALAQSLHTQALTESESARDKEAEPVPTVVVVDPVPRELPPVSRQTALKTVLAFVGTFLGLFGLAALYDLLRQPNKSLSQQQLELDAAIRATPLLRRLATR